MTKKNLLALVKKQLNEGSNWMVNTESVDRLNGDCGHPQAMQSDCDIAAKVVMRVLRSTPSDVLKRHANFKPFYLNHGD